MGKCLGCNKLIYPKRIAASYNAHAARGLCQSCYRQKQKNDEHFDYPPLRRTRDELMEDWVMLRAEGYTLAQAAERLGMKFSAFEKAYYRARSAGDPRAEPSLPRLRSLERRHSK